MTQHRAKRAWAALKEDEMPTLIELLETANRQANGHITELSNQLAEKYAEIEKLTSSLKAVTAQRDQAWLVAEHRELNIATEQKLQAKIEKLEKENAELLDQRIKDLATLANEHRAIQMGRW